MRLTRCRFATKHFVLQKSWSRLSAISLIGIPLIIGCGGGSNSPSSPPSSPASPTVIAISLQPKNITLSTGNSETISPSVRMSDGSAGSATSVNWSASDSNIASVSAQGLVTAKSPGTVTITAASGMVKDTATLMVHPAFTTRTYQSGPLLIMENDAGSDIVQIGLDLTLGGAVARFSINGTDLVAKASYGSHLIAVGLYDGDSTYDSCNGCSSNIGWNPTESCDFYRHGSPILAQDISSDSIYIKNNALEWMPDNKGGGPNKPVTSDIIVEKWITPVPNHPYVFQERYKLTHIGLDQHAEAFNAVASYEINAVYSNWSFYSGANPGTSGALSTVAQTDLPQWPQATGIKWLSENWGAWTNAQGMAFAAYVPQGFPYATASQATGDPADQVSVYSYLTPFSFWPNSSVQFTSFLMLGPVHNLQLETYDIARRIGPFVDTAPPMGVINSTTPAEGSTISGIAPVEGYAFDSSSDTTLELLVDGLTVAFGVPNIRRDDIPLTFAGAPGNSAFHFDLDTTKFNNGQHVIQIRATDKAGNVGLFPKRIGIFAN